MNKQTLEMLEKCERELAQAKEKMTHAENVGGYDNLQFKHWKRETLELMRERREIKTGKKVW